MNIRWLLFFTYILCTSTVSSRLLFSNILLKDGSLIGLTIAGYDISYTEDKRKIIIPLCFSKDNTIKAYTAADISPKQVKAFTHNFQSKAISSRASLLELMKEMNQNTDYTHPKGILYFSNKSVPDITLTGWMGVNPNQPLDKKTFPNFQRKDIGLKDGSSTQMALINILHFWEKNDLIKLPTTSSDKKKLQALYKIVNLKKSTRSSKTNWQNTSSSLLKMSNKTFKGEFAIIPFHKRHNINSAKNTYELLTKLNKSPYHSICLGISLLNEKYDSEGSQALNVISIDGEELELQGWGVRFKARIGNSESIKNRKLNPEQYTELIITTPSLLPKWIKNKKLKLCFKDKGDGIYYFQLMKKVKAGMKWDPPVYDKEDSKR